MAHRRKRFDYGATIAPTTIIATGFGDVHTMHPFNQTGTNDGKPYYQNSEGYKLYWVAADARWYLGANLGDGVGAALYDGPTTTPIGSDWTQDQGNHPAGQTAWG